MREMEQREEDLSVWNIHEGIVGIDNIKTDLHLKRIQIVKTIFIAVVHILFKIHKQHLQPAVICLRSEEVPNSIGSNY